MVANDATLQLWLRPSHDFDKVENYFIPLYIDLFHHLTIEISTHLTNTLINEVCNLRNPNNLRLLNPVTLRPGLKGKDHLVATDATLQLCCGFLTTLMKQ